MESFRLHLLPTLFIPPSQPLSHSVKSSCILILIYFNFIRIYSGKGRQRSFPLNDNAENFSVIPRLANLDARFQEHQAPRIFARFLKVKWTTILPAGCRDCFAGVVCGGHKASGQYPHANASVDEPYAYKRCLSTGAPLILPASLHLTPGQPTSNVLPLYLGNFASRSSQHRFASPPFHLSSGSSRPPLLPCITVTLVFSFA